MALGIREDWANERWSLGDQFWDLGVGVTEAAASEGRVELVRRARGLRSQGWVLFWQQIRREFGEFALHDAQHTRLGLVDTDGIHIERGADLFDDASLEHKQLERAVVHLRHRTAHLLDAVAQVPVFPLLFPGFVGRRGWVAEAGQVV